MYTESLENNSRSFRLEGTKTLPQTEHLLTPCQRGPRRRMCLFLLFFLFFSIKYAYCFFLIHFLCIKYSIVFSLFLSVKISLLVQLPRTSSAVFSPCLSPHLLSETACQGISLPEADICFWRILFFFYEKTQTTHNIFLKVIFPPIFPWMNYLYTGTNLLCLLNTFSEWLPCSKNFVKEIAFFACLPFSYSW